MNDPRHFKAPYNPKERIWQEADRLRAAHPAGRELPVAILDLAEFDLGLELVPVDGLRGQIFFDTPSENCILDEAGIITKLSCPGSSQ